MISRNTLGIALALVLVGAVACKRPSPSGSSASSSAASSPSADAKLGELERHLSYGATWGSDPAAKKIADETQEAITVAWGSLKSELAVAVSIVPGDPRQVVIVAQVKDLKEADKSDRKAIAEEVRDAIKDGLVPTDEVAFGVKGKAFYGIVAHGPARSKWNVKTGTVVGTEPLTQALAKVAAAPAPAAPVKLGESLRVVDMEWSVTSVKDKPKGETKIVLVQLKATNHSKKPRLLERAPKLVDAKGREFTSASDEDSLVPDGKQVAEGQSLQPDVPMEVWAAYEVPADATGLRMRIQGPYEYAAPGYIALGI